MRASQVMTDKPLGIVRFTIHGKPRWKKPSLMFWTETLITEQIGMFRDPKESFRSKLLPAMGTGNTFEDSVWSPGLVGSCRRHTSLRARKPWI